MNYVMDRVEDAYPELPDPDHIEEVLQGTADFIAGVEGFSGAYTRAQQYLWSCLESSDTVSYKARVDGMEGMISEGFAAAWEYVAKIFKGLWNFFFGGGEDSGDSKADKVEKQAEDTGKKMQKLETGNLSDEQATAVLKKGKAKAEKIQKSAKASPAAKSKAKSIEERILAQTSGKNKQKPADTAKELMKQLLEIDDELPVKLNARIQGIDNALNTWQTRLNGNTVDKVVSAANKTTFTKAKTESQAALGTIKGLGLKTMAKITYPDAKKLVEDIRKALKAAREMLEKFKTHKGEIDNQLKSLKANAGNTNAGTDKAKKTQGGKETEDLKKIATLLTNTATAHVSIINQLSGMTDALDEAIAGSVIVI